ncbi:hypothetical protein AGDE_12486 [Angomonas deanei]|nr:hypothetical protein AGDE_12486 [Angomonas deanei]|eukprot:EPY24122.1 hypothetical protein AGDE_12486 [Angomonas deanei]
MNAHDYSFDFGNIPDGSFLVFPTVKQNVTEYTEKYIKEKQKEASRSVATTGRPPKGKEKPNRKEMENPLLSQKNKENRVFLNNIDVNTYVDGSNKKRKTSVDMLHSSEIQSSVKEECVHRTTYIPADTTVHQTMDSKNFTYVKRDPGGDSLSFEHLKNDPRFISFLREDKNLQPGAEIPKEDMERYYKNYNDISLTYVLTTNPVEATVRANVPETKGEKPAEKVKTGKSISDTLLRTTRFQETQWNYIAKVVNKLIAWEEKLGSKEKEKATPAESNPAPSVDKKKREVKEKKPEKKVEKKAKPTEKKNNVVAPEPPQEVEAVNESLMRYFEENYNNATFTPSPVREEVVEEEDGALDPNMMSELLFGDQYGEFLKEQNNITVVQPFEESRMFGRTPQVDRERLGATFIDGENGSDENRNNTTFFMDGRTALQEKTNYVKENGVTCILNGETVLQDKTNYAKSRNNTTHFLNENTGLQDRTNYGKSRNNTTHFLNEKTALQNQTDYCATQVASDDDDSTEESDDSSEEDETTTQSSPHEQRYAAPRAPLKGQRPNHPFPQPGPNGNMPFQRNMNAYGQPVPYPHMRMPVPPANGYPNTARNPSPQQHAPPPQKGNNGGRGKQKTSSKVNTNSWAYYRYKKPMPWLEGPPLPQRRYTKPLKEWMGTSLQNATRVRSPDWKALR